MPIKYNKTSITVEATDQNKNLLVYSHPGDEIKFDFDISSLDKKIINGDLVIYLLNGRTITLVNFGLMTLDNKAPTISDITQTYTPFSLFDNSYYYEDNGVTPYVVSRQISSPDNNVLPPGNQLPSSKEQISGDSSFLNKISQINDSGETNNDVAPAVQDYIIKTLYSNYTKLEQSMVNYTSNNRYRYNEPSTDIYPIKLLFINPKITPEYGTLYTFAEKEKNQGYKDLIVFIGGGKLQGNDYAHYMYEPETINLGDVNSKVWFDGNEQTNMVTRWFYMGLPTPTVIIDKVVISGLPSGVKIPKNLDKNLIIKQLGGGAFEISVKGAPAGGVEIPLQYALGIGGEEGLYSAVSITYEGTQTRTGDAVKGTVTSFFEFKPVRSESDISNFNKFNTFTYSTLRDPLILWFTTNDDVIKGGKGNYTYYGNAGDNKAYGGEADEIFHLGIGNNSFYAGLGNATVDVDNVNKNNSLYLNNAIGKADKDSVTTTINNGKICFSGKHNGKTFTTTAIDFTSLYFDIPYGDGDSDKDNRPDNKDDELTIISTNNLKNNIHAYLGSGKNIVKGTNNSMTIEIKTDSERGDAIFIHTNDTLNGVFVRWDEDSDSYVLGSEKNDTIIGSNIDIPLRFNGTGRGENTADYSNVTLSLTYDASTGSVSKEGNLKNDVIKGIKSFIGGLSKTTFYGSINADITYIGSTNSIEEQNTLSYIKLDSGGDNTLSNGVTIDLNKSEIIKHKTKGVDKFFKIANIQSSNNNDKFIISNDPTSKILDGMGGFNTIDYSNLESNSIFTIYEKQPGTVEKGEKGNYGVDTIKNFRHFIGSSIGSIFNIADTFDDDKCSLFRNNDSNFRFILEGKSNEASNRVSYSMIRGKSMILDLNPDGSTVNIYSGSKIGEGELLATDKLINIGNFFLSSEAENVIYAYNSAILEYAIDGGVKGNNTISFEKSKQAVQIDFSSGIYNNIININNLILSKNNDTVIMGPYSFANYIDGHGGVNKVDFSDVVGPLVFNINLLDIKFNININSGKEVTLRNFQQIISSFGDDVYNIDVDLKDVDKLKDKNIFFDGNLGTNTINFDKVVNTLNPKQGLTIDLSGEYCTVEDIKGNNVLKFTNFINIMGSRGGDTFILPKGSSFYNIDGNSDTIEGAVNAVSYQAYNSGIYINKDIFNKFKNIQKIIGSQGDDIIELDKDTSFNIDGYDGFNVLSYYNDDSFDSVKVNISNISIPDVEVKSLITIDKGNGKTDTLSTIAFLDFENTTVTNGVTFEINNKDNTHLNKKGKVFLNGSKVESGKDANSKIVYKEDLTEITLNLQVESSQIVSGSWINVTKGTSSSVDYLQNISDITLSKNSKVNIFDSIGNLKNVRNLKVDGRGESTLSFEFYSMGIDLDVKNLELSFQNNTKINFIGFTKFTASGVIGTKFTFKSAADKNYTFNGLESDTTLDYNNLTDDITINVSQNSTFTDNIFNSLTINKGTTTDKAYNIAHFVGSQGITKVLVNYSFNKNMTFVGNANKKNENFIDYSGLSETDNISFSITKEVVIAGRASGEYNDTIKNINNIISGKGNTRFIFENDVIGTANVYKLDGGGGINSLSLTSIESDLMYHLNTDGKINISLNDKEFASIKNIHVIFGTNSKVNNFKLGNFFEGKYIASGSLKLYGNKSSDKDILDLTETNKGLSLDPLAGKIVESNSSEELSLITIIGVSTILLGDGNHQIDISNKTSSAGWKKVVGGKGQNNVSFDKMVTSINYNLAEGVEGLEFKLINFTGVTGTRNNDTFYLTENKIEGIRINGNGGSNNILDYSRLNVSVTVNIFTQKVTRGDKTDTVENISIFKSGSAGGKFISTENGYYEFHGLDTDTSKNILDYSSVNDDLLFSFINNSVVKPNSFYDRFYNITEFIGGSGEVNNFLFALSNLSKKIKEITIDGGKGKNNIINLSQLERGIVYDIDKQYFEVDNQGAKLTVILKNINTFIGSSHQDTFIFSDKTNGITINGGNKPSGVDNIIDLSRVTNSVTINFASREILYGNNKNYFFSVNTFIGSQKGGDTFSNLNGYALYNITGGAGGNNTVIYNDCSTPITMRVENNKVIIFKGGISDKLVNIQNLTLTDLSDVIELNQRTDFKDLSIFKVIDGGLGNNEVVIKFNIEDEDKLTIDLSEGKVTYNQNHYDLNLKNFGDLLVTKEAFNPNANYTIIAHKDLNSLRSIRFAGLTNKLQNYYSTLDIKSFSGNLYFSITQNSNNVVKMFVSSVSVNHNVYLENVTRIILPKGEHFVDYGKVVYSNANSNTFNITFSVSDESLTTVSYLFDSIENTVGKTYICFDGIKFSEKGTNSDILFSGKTSLVTINKLISSQDSIVILFGDSTTSKMNKLSLVFKELAIHNDTFILKNIASKEKTKELLIKFINRDTTSVNWVDKTVNFAFTNINNLYNLEIDSDSYFSNLVLQFGTLKTTFKQLTLDYSNKVSRQYYVDFSEMTTSMGGGNVYTRFDLSSKDEYFSFNNNTPSESDRFFAMYHKNLTEANAYAPGGVVINNGSGHNFYEFVISDKKLPTGADRNYSYEYSFVEASSNSSYTAKISLVKKYNELNFNHIVINLSEIKGKLTILNKETNIPIGVVYLLPEKTDLTIQKTLILNLDEKLFAGRIDYNFVFVGSNIRTLNNIILPAPNNSSKYITTNHIEFGKEIVKSQIAVAQNIMNISTKSDTIFADMIAMFGNNIRFNISNIKLSNPINGPKNLENNFILSNNDMWNASSELLQNSLSLQSNDGTSFLKSFYNYCSNGLMTWTKFSLFYKSPDLTKYDTYLDASGMPFGTSSELYGAERVLIDYTVSAANRPEVSFYAVREGDTPQTMKRFFAVVSSKKIFLQREDVSFPIIVDAGNTKYLVVNFFLDRFGGTFFSFGDMNKMKLPPVRSYQIFTKSDRYMPSDKLWNGQTSEVYLSKTYTNFVKAMCTHMDDTIFDVNNNGTLHFSNKVNVSGCNGIMLTNTYAKATYLTGLNYKSPFLIYIQNNPFIETEGNEEFNFFITEQTVAQDNVVIRFLRGNYYNVSEDPCRAITLTNDRSYNAPEFKYYGTIYSSFSKFVVQPTGYIVKSNENRDLHYNNIPKEPKVRNVDLNQGVYSFEEVDYGDKPLNSDIKSAIVFFNGGFNRHPINNSPGFSVTDFDTVSIVGGKVPKTKNWMKGLLEVGNKGTVYTGVNKFIITGHKNNYNSGDNDQQVGLQFFLDPKTFNQSYNVVIQRGYCHGSMLKHVSDFVALDLAGIEYIKPDRASDYNCSILFNGKNLGLSFGSQIFLVKDTCIGSTKGLHDLNAIKFGESCKNVTCAFGSDLLIPDWTPEYVTYYFTFEYVGSNTKINIVLPPISVSNLGYGLNYRYEIKSLDGDAHKQYELIISLKDALGVVRCTYDILFWLNNPNNPNVIDFFFTNSQGALKEYITDNLKDLYDVTSEGNEGKIDLDKVKDTTTREKYFTWNNQQEYLDSLDKTSAKKDYWISIDKYLENAFNVNNIDNNNNKIIKGMQTINLGTFSTQENINSNQDIYFVDINADADNNIFESNSKESFWDKYTYAKPDENYNDELNNTEYQKYEDIIENGNTNHSHQDSNILDNETDSNSDQNTHTTDNIDLSNLFEKVKSISENIDNTKLVEEFGLSNFTLEELNHTYQQDEANSMSYTIDGCNNIASNYSSDYTIETTTQENQKNKTNH